MFVKSVTCKLDENSSTTHGNDTSARASVHVWKYVSVTKPVLLRFKNKQRKNIGRKYSINTFFSILEKKLRLVSQSRKETGVPHPLLLVCCCLYIYRYCYYYFLKRLYKWKHTQILRSTYERQNTAYYPLRQLQGIVGDAVRLAAESLGICDVFQNILIPLAEDSLHIQP